jgi:hypothetical protein
MGYGNFECRGPGVSSGALRATQKKPRFAHLTPHMNGIKYTRAHICKPLQEPRNRFSAWRASTTTLLSYRPARLHRLAESNPRSRFLGSINVYKYQLRPRAKLSKPNVSLEQYGMVRTGTYRPMYTSFKGRTVQE